MKYLDPEKNIPKDYVSVASFFVNLFKKRSAAPITEEKKFTIAVLYSWNHRPNECSWKKESLRESLCSDLGEKLREYASAGFELKSVIKYEEYTNYILQRIDD